MGTYRQYCPIARASEILAERWNPLIVRNLMFGADTFSAIARGVPTMSRSMLLKRLAELERAGVIESWVNPEGRDHNYRLTEAGADLAGIIGGLATWGEQLAGRNPLGRHQADGPRVATPIVPDMERAPADLSPAPGLRSSTVPAPRFSRRQTFHDAALST